MEKIPNNLKHGGSGIGGGSGMLGIGKLGGVGFGTGDQ